MRVRFITTVMAVAVAACTDPTLSPSHVLPLLAVSDGANGGNVHFFFLPPMVPNPGHGDNDESISPAVVICQWDGAGCATTLATFTTDPGTTTTTQPGNSETVRVNRSHAIVNWHTGAFGLDESLTYRICVKVGDVEVGYADVDVVATGGEARDAADGFIGVVNGRTLPIKFRIEEGALSEPSTNGCGSQDT